MSKNTIVVNLLAGSGAGKSTNAARLFAMLKDMNVEAELATEYVKDMVWEGRTKVFECQPYIFGKQLYKLVRLNGVVEVIITDSPIILSAVYDPDQDWYFKEFALNQFNKFNNLNFFLNRTKPFNPNGRNEKTLEEAVCYDNKLLSFLGDNKIPFTTVDGNQEGCEKMLSMILLALWGNSQGGN